MDTTQTPFRNYFCGARIIHALLLVIFFDVLIAVFNTATGLNHSIVISLVMSQSFGIPISVLIFSLLWLVDIKGKKGRLILVCLIGSLCGYFIGFWIGAFILDRIFSIKLNVSYQMFSAKNIVLVTLFSGVISYFFYSVARFRISAELIRQERINRISSEKDALEAKLRLLQAQVEPHFLFNTLSNILSLIDTDPAKSKIMLSDLTKYLRTSLSRTLPSVTTLDQELEMIRSYLGIQKVRMGERLNFIIMLPDELRQFPFPPMLLQPLVENAVEHGLDGQVEGGTITIKAAQNGSSVLVEVIDTGAGFSDINHPGVGIANVRERLQLLYGDKGRLNVEENAPHGVRAIIEIA